MDVRMERVMERGFDDVAGPLSRDRARDLIRKADRDTSGYMRYMFNIDWLEAHNWDLVINTGRFSVTETVEIVASIVSSGALEPSALGRQRPAHRAPGGRGECRGVGGTTGWRNAVEDVPPGGQGGQ